MVIAIVGPQNTGKSTFIQDFLVEFPMYKTHHTTLREYIKANGLQANQGTNKKSQEMMLEYYINLLKEYKRGEDNVILDRSALDCFVYTLRAYFKNNCDIDAEFVKQFIPKVREAMKNIDIVFFIPKLKNDGIVIKEDGFRDTDPTFIEEINSIFQKIIYEKLYSGKSDLFDPEDSPALIEIFGTRKQRVDIAKLYVNVDSGELIMDEKSVLDSENLEALEAEIAQQQKMIAQSEHTYNSQKFIADKIRKG